MLFNKTVKLILVQHSFLVLQKQLKVSLRRRCKNALSTDWLTHDKAKNFPLRDYYVGLKQNKKIRKALRDTKVDLERIHDIFNIEIEDGPIKMAVIGRFYSIYISVEN